MSSTVNIAAPAASRIPVLAAASFATATQSFVFAALLGEMAADLDVPLAQAGQLATAFALTFGLSAPVVAAAPPYWGRSHFQAQDCVENGTAKPDGAQTGWLNRCIACMPGVDGLACAAVMPLTMRGLSIALKPALG